MSDVKMGFARLTPEERRAMASIGGKAAQAVRDQRGKRHFQEMAERGAAKRAARHADDLEEDAT
jgi:hypothetical protein